MDDTVRTVVGAIGGVLGIFGFAVAGTAPTCRTLAVGVSMLLGGAALVFAVMLTRGV